jgi:hypothetical protein
MFTGDIDNIHEATHTPWVDITEIIICEEHLGEFVRAPSSVQIGAKA